MPNDLRTISANSASFSSGSLINVTRFFRDPESFETLKRVVLPRIVHDRAADSAIRIWVAGCATGEEAYSIAILLQEYLTVSA